MQRFGNHSCVSVLPPVLILPQSDLGPRTWCSSCSAGFFATSSSPLPVHIPSPVQRSCQLRALQVQAERLSLWLKAFLQAVLGVQCMRGDKAKEYKEQECTEVFHTAHFNALQGGQATSFPPPIFQIKYSTHEATFPQPNSHSRRGTARARPLHKQGSLAGQGTYPAPPGGGRSRITTQPTAATGYKQSMLSCCLRNCWLI